MKNIFKKVLSEMNYVSNVDEVVFEEGVMCIEGLISWDEIGEMDEDECRDFIECNVFSDDEIDV
jgi:hypothetical protein